MNASRSGFTLMEVLVAMVIMAIIGSVLLHTLSLISRSWQATQPRSEKLHELQRLVLTAWYDGSQIALQEEFLPPTHPPLQLSETSAPVTFLRDGWANPVGEPRGTLQWVRYRQDGKALKRQSASFTELMNNAQPPDNVFLQHEKLLSSDAQIGSRVVDRNAGINAQWPPVAQTAVPVAPKVLQLQLTLPPYGDIALHLPLASPEHEAPNPFPATTR